MATATPLDQETACKILIDSFQRIMRLFRAPAEDTLFPLKPADIQPLLEIRLAPTVVTGVYDTGEQYLVDALDHYSRWKGVTREQIPHATLGVLGELVHLLSYLLHNGCMVYSARDADQRPVFYVGLTTTSTHCVAVSYHSTPTKD